MDHLPRQTSLAILRHHPIFGLVGILTLNCTVGFTPVWAGWFWFRRRIDRGPEISRASYSVLAGPDDAMAHHGVSNPCRAEITLDVPPSFVKL